HTHTHSHPSPAASGRGAVLKALLVPHPAAADIIPAGGRAEAPPPPPPDGRSPGELPAGPRPTLHFGGCGAAASLGRPERAVPVPSSPGPAPSPGAFGSEQKGSSPVSPGWAKPAESSRSSRDRFFLFFSIMSSQRSSSMLQ
ncbi:hypothetical protein DV515_00007990, partial [Chloebia gouldiae]